MQTDFATWIDAHLEVRWRGDEGAFRCPFHHDEHASATINRVKGAWTCHACGAGGGLRRLAEGLGVEPPDFGGQREEVVYQYRDESGAVAYEQVRIEQSEGKTFRGRRPDGRGGYIWNLRGVTPLPYRLPELLAAQRAGEPVLVAEGEKDCDALAQLGFCATCNHGGAGKWRPEHARHFGRGTRTYVFADADEPGQAHLHTVAALLKARGCEVLVPDLGYPVVEKHGKDVSDWLSEDPFRSRLDLEQLFEQAKPWTSPDQPDEEPPELATQTWDPHEGHHHDNGRPKRQSKKRQTTKDRLAAIGEELELFRAPGGDPFATAEADGHHETHKIRTVAFRQWLAARYWQRYQEGVGTTALNDAVNQLAGRALAERAEREVYLRVAEHEGSIYLDLADDTWRALEVRDDGWDVVADPPVRFRRSPGLRALPEPEPGGDVELLRRYLHLEDEASFALVVGWLLMALSPRGDYPILVLFGEQGSGKTLTAEMLRLLVDPVRAPLRSAPKDVEDLMVAVENGWVLALDNLSHVPDWLSDAMCRISSGAGFAKREKYSDLEEITVEAWRPQLLNGIPAVARRSDLLDRSILLQLPPIVGHKRSQRAQILKRFHADRPAIFSALLDGLSAALDQRPSVEAEGMQLPRMADFAVWAEAGTRGLGMEPGTFWAAYVGAVDQANEVALQASPVSEYLLRIVETRDFVGTVAELMTDLEREAPEPVRRARGWPRSSTALGIVLQRMAPNFRAAGIDVAFRRSHGRRWLHIGRSLGDELGDIS